MAKKVKQMCLGSCSLAVVQDRDWLQGGETGPLVTDNY